MQIYAAPSGREKGAQRERIQRQTEAFLAAGKRISHIPAGLNRENPLTNVFVISGESLPNVDNAGLLNIVQAAQRMGIHAIKLRLAVPKGKLNRITLPPMADPIRHLYDPVVIDAWVTKFGKQGNKLQAKEEATA